MVTTLDSEMRASLNNDFSKYNECARVFNTARWNYEDSIEELIKSILKRTDKDIEFEPTSWIVNQLDDDAGVNLYKIKLNKSGDQVLVVDEDGNEYGRYDFYMNDYFQFIAMVIDDYLFVEE